MSKILKMGAIVLTLAIVMAVLLTSVAMAAGNGNGPNEDPGTCPNLECPNPDCPNQDCVCDGDQLPDRDRVMDMYNAPDDTPRNRMGNGWVD